MNDRQKILEAQDALDEAREQVAEDQRRTSREHMTPQEKRMIRGLEMELERLVGKPIEGGDRRLSAHSEQTASDSSRHSWEFGNADARSTGPWPSFGRYLQSLRCACRPGGRADDRLFERRAGSESVPSDGGFLVHSQFEGDIIRQVSKRSMFLPYCRTIEIGEGANGCQVPLFDESSRASSRFGGCVGYWLGEGATITESQPKFRQLNMSLKKVCALMTATDELVEDAVALGEIVGNAFISELAWQIDHAILRGSGAGRPLGVTESGALIEQPIETGQTLAGGSVTSENVVGMWSRLSEEGQQSAVWVTHRSNLPSLYSLGLQVGLGGGSPVFQPPGGLSQSPYATILGRPLLVSEHASAPGTVGDFCLIDFSDYLIIRKGDIRVASTIAADFATGQTKFRWTWRVDGQPMTRQPLTPYSGSDTTSPYVCLAARS